MSSNTLIEVFGQIVYRLTRNVTEHYNPEEPEFTTESFGYDPLLSTGREWNYEPVDELIYQEYSDREATNSNFFAYNNINVQVRNAFLPEDSEETREQNGKDEEMARKLLRPSFVQTVCKSMYIGALISFLSAVFIALFYLLISFVCYKTILHCQNYPKELIPIRVQWMKTISDAISSFFYYFWFFGIALFLFRPFQLKGVRKTLFLILFVSYCLDASYRLVLVKVGVWYYLAPKVYQTPLYSFFFLSVCLQLYVLGKQFRARPIKMLLVLMCKMLLPFCLPVVFGIFLSDVIYGIYITKPIEGKLLIALFAPVVVVVLKIVSRLCVQRLRNITHPGYSYVLLVPLYYGTAVVLRALQADLDNLPYIALLGVIHGVAEVVERSVMVVVYHTCTVLWKRKLAPWGSFRAPRRERLMADIAIISMLYESTAVISVNGLFGLYQYVYTENDSIINLLKTFAVHTSVQLVIEWFFTSVSLAIETRYQNMAVMAVWRRRWKRHILAALVNTVPLAVWNSVCMLIILRASYSNIGVKQPCKMPFS